MTSRNPTFRSNLQKWTLLLALSLLLLPAAAFGRDLVLQAVQFPEDRDVDFEFTAVHSVPGSMKGEVEFEDGDADVRIKARDMVPALALGGDVASYVVWAVPRSGVAENLGELPILDGDEKFESTTDLKEFAVLVTLEEHPYARQPSSLIVFQNLPTDDGGARTSAMTYHSVDRAPRIGDRVARLRLHDECEWHIAQARQVYELAKERNAEQYAPDRVRDARVALGQAENYLDGHREEESIDYATRSLNASADALLIHHDEVVRQARLAQERADEAQKQALAHRAESAEQRGERLESELDASERSRLTLHEQVAERNHQLAELKSRETELVTEQQQAQSRLDEARAELKALDMDREDARARADLLMQERARLSRVVGELAQEKDSLAAERRQLIARTSDLQKENQTLAEQKAAAEAEMERLAQEKAAIVADLYGTLSEIADTRQTARGLVVSLPDVLFDFDKATLRPRGTQTLAKLAGVAMIVPELEFSIEGHTDSIGTETYNDWLSEARAESVADFLAQEGVASARMETEGFGEDKPVATNETDEGRQKNRRVEVVIDADSLPAIPEQRASLN